MSSCCSLHTSGPTRCVEWLSEGFCSLHNITWWGAGIPKCWGNINGLLMLTLQASNMFAGLPYFLSKRGLYSIFHWCTTGHEHLEILMVIITEINILSAATDPAKLLLELRSCHSGGIRSKDSKCYHMLHACHLTHWGRDKMARVIHVNKPSAW